MRIRRGWERSTMKWSSAQFTNFLPFYAFWVEIVRCGFRIPRAVMSNATLRLVMASGADSLLEHPKYTSSYSRGKIGRVNYEIQARDA